MLSREMTDELVMGLCGIFGRRIHQIILYGSVARNSARADSDIDIAIILDDALQGRERELFIEFAANMDMKYEKVFSIVDIEKSRMDLWGNSLPFYKSIRDEGIVLWKAA